MVVEDLDNQTIDELSKWSHDTIAKGSTDSSSYFQFENNIMNIRHTESPKLSF